MIRTGLTERAATAACGAAVALLPAAGFGGPSGRLRALVVVGACAAALSWIDAGSAAPSHLPRRRRVDHPTLVTALCAATAASVLAVFWTCVVVVTSPSWTREGIGLAVMAAGAGLRGAAIRWLGAVFVSELQWSDEQRLVTDGPYRLLRHPGDWGLCIAVGACALAEGNMTAGALWTATLLPLTVARTMLENRFLSRVTLAS
jgi:protein-S-isoprenylcysteine O-methyltransferase Ste14